MEVSESWIFNQTQLVLSTRQRPLDDSGTTYCYYLGQYEYPETLAIGQWYLNLLSNQASAA
jgi:hypothetical protein